ncbi:hypothetical protein VW23_003595 [Devosia insulae DS-56]|uniref:OmpR/PhoB-type domain-containing protein n=2 Tax=Devosia insulae TaxID=408174 RepID=A0A1E5XJE7_9HYPH|nr:hypothetical protein VW23_003595 [Devosia insulae DS-56]
MSGRLLVHDPGDWELDLDRGELRHHGAIVPLSGRAFEIFVVLAEASGSLVTKDQLMQGVWPGSIVEDNTLQAHISVIRKALGDDRNLLKTFSGRGYRLIGHWSRLSPANSPSPAATMTEPASTPAGSSSNIPVALSQFIGRATIASHLADVLATHRAVTLTGPGGIGKTALSLEVARKWSAGTIAAAYIVDLAPLADPGLIPSAIATTLSLRPGGGQATPTTVAQAIGDASLLLILDTCEHLIAGAAVVVETILQICPRVTVLATSRENLRIEGEYVYRLPPLDVPAETERDHEAILTQDAVQLFVTRLAAFDSAPTPTTDDLLEIAGICRRLDGIPLAIEFAASRAVALGIREVALGLHDRFGLLTAGRRTALPRHQTLRATLDWSYELLPEAERRLLRRVSIFPSGFTAAAASAVVSDGRVSTSDVMDGIANLVEKSVVTFDGPPSARRWRLLDTIRAYGLEKLAEHEETEQASRLSAEYYRDLFRLGDHAGQGQFGAEPSANARRDIDNIRAAVSWAFSEAGDVQTGLELTASSVTLWFQLTLMVEYRERVDRALQILMTSPAPDEAMEMRLQAALGHAVWYSGPTAMADPGELERPFTRALELAERLGDTEVQLQALWSRWAAGRGRGDENAALKAAKLYEVAARQHGHPRVTVLADRMLALTYHDLGAPLLAGEHVDQVLRRAPLLDPATNSPLQLDARISMLALQTRVLWLQGYPDRAHQAAQEAIATAMQMENWFAVCYVINIGACPLSLWMGDLPEARARAELIRTRAAGNHSWLRHADVYAGILRLRGTGDPVDALTAAYVEARVQFSTTADLISLLSDEQNQPPDPDYLPSHAGWSLPEVVNAELVLWRGGPDSIAKAEAALERSLELARNQSALSWQLRTALSLARVRVRQHRAKEALVLLRSIYEGFTEGFETLDLRTAKSALDTLTAGTQ